MRELTVTAAVIRNSEGKILICQRADDSSMGGLWEFPGGKLEPGETLEECIIRECKEELAVDLSVTDIFAQTQYQYPDKLINFTFFNAVINNGDIQMNVHKDIKWVSVSEIKNYEFCPADIEILDMIEV
ncbi:MAG: 8-oxo-dGTP diphosphatase MutT [Candidatus Ornithomonoglobus sp.]